jgi:hypothetical protein
MPDQVRHDAFAYLIAGLIKSQATAVAADRVNLAKADMDCSIHPPCQRTIFAKYMLNSLLKFDLFCVNLPSFNNMSLSIE